MYLLFSQSNPVYPEKQSHAYALIPSTHAPLWHGLDAHSFMSERSNMNIHWNGENGNVWWWINNTTLMLTVLTIKTRVTSQTGTRVLIYSIHAGPSIFTWTGSTFINIWKMQFKAISQTSNLWLKYSSTLNPAFNISVYNKI